MAASARGDCGRASHACGVGNRIRPFTKYSISLSKMSSPPSYLVFNVGLDGQRSENVVTPWRTARCSVASKNSHARRSGRDAPTKASDSFMRALTSTRTGSSSGARSRLKSSWPCSLSSVTPMSSASSVSVGTSAASASMQRASSASLAAMARTLVRFVANLTVRFVTNLLRSGRDAARRRGGAGRTDAG